MSDVTITLLILVVAVAFFVWNRLPVGIVALGVALSLWATGVISLEQAFAGFGSTTVILIASLFVVAEGLDAAGITTWAGQQVMAHAGESRIRLVVLVMATGALLSAVLTPNGAAAALIPMVVVLAVRFRMSPSQLLMPLAFATHAGSLLVLTGSPVNVLVAEAATATGGRELRFFEFARVGLPLVVGTILVAVLFGDRLLPRRTAKTLPRDLSQLPQTLLRQYLPVTEVARLRVGERSSLVGRAGPTLDLRQYADVRLIGTQDRRGRPLADAAFEPGTLLVVRGPHDTVTRLAADYALSLERGATTEAPPAELVDDDQGVAEVLIAPRSRYLGETVFPGMVTESGSLVVLAVQRNGDDVGPGEVVLQAGDALLLQGRWDALDQHTRDPNVLLVDAPDAMRRQAAPLGPRARPALAILGAMVVLLTTGAVPAAVAGLVAALAMILLRIVTVEQAHRALSWTTLILVAGMIPLSTAITETGAADLLANAVLRAVGGAGPLLLLLVLALFTVTLGQLISNTATALILIPITVSIAADTGISALPLLMCVNVASAASLLTPVATPANMMVMGPGGYRFGDYMRLGLPVLLLYLLTAVVLVPVWWPW